MMEGKFMVKKLLFMVIVLMVSVSILACSGEIQDEVQESEQELEQEQITDESQEADEQLGYPMTITDSYDRQVTIESRPQRVISLAPSVTETIFAIHAEHLLVGRTEFCDFPREVERIDTVGTLQEPNLERIVELDPDLVIVSTHFRPELIERFEDLGINLVGFYGDGVFEGVYVTIEQIGKVLGYEDRSQMIVGMLKNQVEDIKEAVDGRPRPEVYYVLGYGKGGDFTAGSDTFIGKMIEMAGGLNSASDVEGWSYSLEKLLENDPDILICSKYFDAKEGIMNTNGYKDLRAVKEGDLYPIDNNLLDRQGPRLADGLYELAKIIHPDAF